MTKAPWTKEGIVTLLDRRVDAVLRGMEVLYKLQTADEQRAGMAQEHNKVGYSKWDAPFMTSLVQEYRRRGQLTDRQLASARRIVKKYAGQLTKVANGQLVVPR